MNKFIPDMRSVPWKPEDSKLKSDGVYIGKGSNAAEVVVLHGDSRPTKRQMTNIWKNRKERRANPVLVVVTYSDKAALCGPAGEKPPVNYGLNQNQVKRICTSILNKPNRHVVRRFMRKILDQIDDELIGVRNQSLLSTHELKTGVRQRPDWQDALDKSKGLTDRTGKNLVEGLGYRLDPTAVTGLFSDVKMYGFKPYRKDNALRLRFTFFLPLLQHTSYSVQRNMYTVGALENEHSRRYDTDSSK
jgi:hypothetical protein